MTEAQSRLDTVREFIRDCVGKGLTEGDFLNANADRIWRYDVKSPYYQNIDLLRDDLIMCGYGKFGQLKKLFNEVSHER